MYENAEERVFALKELKMTEKEIAEVFVNSNGMTFFQYTCFAS